MINKAELFDRYHGMVFDCEDSLWELYNVEENKVVLQDITYGNLMSVDFSNWEEFVNEYEYHEPLSESLQAQLEVDFEKEFGPYEDDKIPLTWEQFKAESEAMDNFVREWRRNHGI